ncbi:MAG: FtsX-like permease family protein, partial [Myxococcota bacterium]
VREYRCRVVGVSPRALLIGISIPAEYVRQMNAPYEGADSYRAAFVTVADVSDLSRIGAAIERMGLKVDETGRTIGGIVTVATGLLSVLSVLIVMLSALHMAHAFFMLVRERRKDIGVMRAVGATRRDIAAVIVAEAAVTGVFSGAAGVAAGYLCTRVANWMAVAYLPPFPFKPDDFFVLTPVAVALAMAMTVFFCVAGAVWPAAMAAGMDPSESLRE